MASAKKGINLANVGLNYLSMLGGGALGASLGVAGMSYLKEAIPVDKKLSSEEIKRRQRLDKELVQMTKEKGFSGKFKRVSGKNMGGGLYVVPDAFKKVPKHQLKHVKEFFKKEGLEEGTAHAHNNAAAGVAAHELVHSRAPDNPILRKAQSLYFNGSMNIPTALTVGAMVPTGVAFPRSKAAKIIPALAALTQVPKVIEEGRANYVGYQDLKEAIRRKEGLGKDLEGISAEGKEALRLGKDTAIGSMGTYLSAPAAILAGGYAPVILSSPKLKEKMRSLIKRIKP